MQTTCSACGMELPPDAPRGLCPACLFQLDEPTAAEHSANSSAPTAGPALGTRWFGDYELLDEIARGGMGIVYRARQVSLDRIVAVKMILFGSLANAEQVRRFRIEASAAGSLQHPNIVAVHEVGLHDGQNFMVMDYVDGPNLARIVQDQPLPAKKAASYLKAIAEAVQFAHERGILHRDLKPSNVLIGSDDRPRVTDFGLAKRFDTESSLTLSGHVIGSPNYLPPEQAGGGRHKVGRASDVYSLGAILYHLLTARPPFRAETLSETLQQVQQTEPLSPRLLNPSMPRDLETICLKCLEKEPAKRYATAQALADELDRFLRDEPIHARPVTRAERAWRWCRRKPAMASALVLVLLLVLVVGIGSPIAAYRINRERRKAEAQAYTSDMNLVLQAWEEGNLRRAQALLRAHFPKPGEPDLRGFEWRYLWQLCQDESRYAFTNFDVGALAFSPDGKFLAAGGGQVLKLLDIKSGTELGELRYGETNDDILCLAFSPRSTNVLATGGELGVLRLWNLATREITTLATHPSGVGSIAFSPDGKLLAAAQYYHGNALTVWNVDLRQAVWTTNTYVSPNAVAFTPDGKALVSGGGGGNGNARVWEVATGKELPPFPELHKGWINYIAFAPDGRTMATCAADDRLILWDFADRRAKAPPLRHGGNAMAFSADGRLMASIGFDGVARAWDVASQQPVAVLRSLAPAWRALAFTPDSTRIVFAGSDRKVRLWDAVGLPDKDQLKGHEHWAHQVAFSPDGERLASVDFYEGLTKLRDVPSRRFITDLPGNPGDRSAGGAAFSPNGKLLVTSSYSGTVVLWDTATLERRGVFTNDFGCACLAFSPGGEVLAVATGFVSSRPNIPRSLAFWEITTRRKINRLTEAAHDAAAVSFSNNGWLVAVGYYDGWVRLWDCIDDGMLVVENPMYGPWNAWWDMPSDRHSGIGNVSFSDGHVRPVKWRYPKRYSIRGQSVGPAKEDWQDFRRAQGWVPVK